MLKNDIAVQECDATKV